MQLAARMLLAAVAAASVAAAAGDIATIPLWTAYVEGWPTCYRQPLLVRAENTLLAFVEGRPGIPWCR